MERTGVIIVAGGSGSRAGGARPKQFRFLGGMPVLARTINTFAAALPGAEIVAVLPEQHIGFWKNLSARFDVAEHKIAAGGAERFHSVRNGLAALTSDPGLIAVQDGGYAEVSGDALNAQDVCGPSYAPAFSMSRTDAELLKAAMNESGEAAVTLDADSRVGKNGTSYNIVGTIPGRDTESMVLMSAHYDSYFAGFQDDNAAIALMMGIAKGLIDSGYQPEKTLVFCAMAAEEWGVSNTRYDWSTGAYEQVFTVHPEWRGQVIADLNFELPALAHGTRARIRSTYEYVDFLEEFLENLPELTQGYPEETRITAPIETWSDDFSIAIAGIPSMVNDFTGGSFMETHYHSQFDNDTYYDEDVYRLHHELFGLLLMAIDRTRVVPLNFAGTFQKAKEALDLDWCARTEADGESLAQALDEAAELAQQVYDRAAAINRGQEPGEDAGRLERQLLNLFQQTQDTFVRIDWYGNVQFPQESLQQSLELLHGAADSLTEGNLSAALRKLYEIDNNRYAFLFEQRVYRHFTQYVFSQPKERLKWGYRRIVGYINLYATVKSLLEKKAKGITDYTAEAAFLQGAAAAQEGAYRDLVGSLNISVEEMKRMLRDCLPR